MNNSIRQLREITQVLLSPDLNYMAVRNPCTALYDFFCSMAGFDINDPDAICPLGDLMKFDADSALQIGHCIRNAATALDEVTLPVSQTLNDRCSQLALLTHIRVYKKTELRLNESSLTIPHKLANLSAVDLPATLTFIYELGESPGFRIKGKGLS